MSVTAALDTMVYAVALNGFDAVPARRAYEDLFAAWKGADTDIPILQQARAEYAKLR